MKGTVKISDAHAHLSGYQSLGDVGISAGWNGATGVPTENSVLV